MEITPFDNEISLTHKAARILDIPARFVLVHRPSSEAPFPGKGSPRDAILAYMGGFRFESAFQRIREYIAQGRTLLQIHEALPDIGVTDLAMAYYSLAPERAFAEINALHLATDRSPFVSEEQLANNFAEWARQNEEGRKAERETLALLEDVQRQLMKVAPLSISPVSFTSLSGYVDYRTTRVERGDAGILAAGFDLFNGSTLSYEIPYVRYNRGERIDPEAEETRPVERYSKVFLGTPEHAPPDLSVTIQRAGNTPAPNSIYLTVWTGVGNPEKATKESFVAARFALAEKRLYFDAPIGPTREPRMVLDRIRRGFPVDFGQIAEAKTGGEFFVYDLELDDTVLLHLVLNDPIFSTYLYIDETIKAYPSKKRLHIHFRSKIEGGVDLDGRKRASAVSVSFTQHQMEEDGPMPTLDGDRSLPAGTNYVRVNILRSASRLTAWKFANIFASLMRFYKNAQPQVSALYARYIPNVFSVLEREGLVRRKATKSKASGKLAELQAAAPSLIVHNFARECQCARQPRIVPDSDVAAWDAVKVWIGRTVAGRQVMRFPRGLSPEGTKWNFICPSELYPYPGVKVNRTLSNRNVPEYSHIPCCYKNDQTASKKTSGYNAYFNNQRNEGSKPGRTITTDKILNTGRLGAVPSTTMHMLRQALDPNATTLELGSPAITIYRVGVPRSKSSFLHCVLQATGEENYIELQTDEERESYARKWRAQLPNGLHPDTLRQENYDVPTETVHQRMTDPQIFLDPALYYRALEIWFGINIYVFIPPGGEEEFATIEIPRHRLFHARPHRDLPTLIVYKHWGAESDGLEYPQCEFIVSAQGTDPPEADLFDGQVAQALHTAMTNIDRPMSWIDQGNKLLVNQPNMFSSAHFSLILAAAGTVTSQLVDSHGKVQAFAVAVDGQTLVVAVPPSQPENLPPLTPPFSRAPLAFALAVFANIPSAVTREGGRVTGVWFPFALLSQGLYVAVEPTEDASLATLPEGLPDPIAQGEESAIARLEGLRRTLEIMLRSILWTFVLSGMKTDDFVEAYFARGNEGSGADSAKIYDVMGMRGRLPPVSTRSPRAAAEAAIEYIGTRTTGFVREKRFYAYSERLYEGWRYFLTNYSRANEGLPPAAPNETVIKYGPADFYRQDGVAIFVREEDLAAWRNSVAASEREDFVHTRLSIALGLGIEPYIYRDDVTGRSFIVQNVAGGSRLRALAVASNWYATGVNSGFRTPEIQTVPPPHVVYGIPRSAIITLVDNQSFGQEVYFELLLYGESENEPEAKVRKYAALLPLP